ncbi:MAG: hypothetical protein ACK6EB_20935, partial [Planctomyces sp.]
MQSTKTVQVRGGSWQTQQYTVGGGVDACGCPCPEKVCCKRVWVPTCETKEIPVTTYECVTEEVPHTVNVTKCRQEQRSRMVNVTKHRTEERTRTYTVTSCRPEERTR